jgi:hypothetical protein
MNNAKSSNNLKIRIILLYPAKIRKIQIEAGNFATVSIRHEVQRITLTTAMFTEALSATIRINCKVRQPPDS